MTEQAKARAKTALDVAREWLDARAHAEDCRIVRVPLSECDCRDYASLAVAIEAYAQAAVQRAREEDCAAMCWACREGEPVLEGERWTHPNRLYLCSAHRIREAHAREARETENGPGPRK